MKRIRRRRFLQYGLGASASLAVPWTGRIPVAHAAMGGKLAKYVEPLPVPGAGIVVATPSGPNAYSFTQTQISRQLHPQLPPTPVWAYDDGSGLTGQSGSFGMAVAARSGTPLTVSYTHSPGSRFTGSARWSRSRATRDSPIRRTSRAPSDRRSD